MVTVTLNVIPFLGFRTSNIPLIYTLPTILVSLSLLVTSTLTFVKDHSSLRRNSDSTSVLCSEDGAKMCFSCASEDTRSEWSGAYGRVLSRPGNFSQACDNMKIGQHRMHVVTCMSSCVTLIEPQFVFGMPVRQRYIRGCLDSMFASINSKRLVNRMVPRSHMLSGLYCRQVSRNDLFHNPALRSDNLTLCVCACDRCNIFPEPLRMVVENSANRFGDQENLIHFMLYWLISLLFTDRLV